MTVSAGGGSKQAGNGDVSHFMRPPAATARLCERHGEVGAREDRPQGATEGEAGAVEEALRLLGRSGDTAEIGD